jgi:hypothetical protein
VFLPLNKNDYAPSSTLTQPCLTPIPLFFNIPCL